MCSVVEATVNKGQEDVVNHRLQAFRMQCNHLVKILKTVSKFKDKSFAYLENWTAHLLKVQALYINKVLSEKKVAVDWVEKDINHFSTIVQTVYGLP